MQEKIPNLINSHVFRNTRGIIKLKIVSFFNYVDDTCMECQYWFPLLLLDMILHYVVGKVGHKFMLHHLKQIIIV